MKKNISYNKEVNIFKLFDLIFQNKVIIIFFVLLFIAIFHFQKKTDPNQDQLRSIALIKKPSILFFSNFISRYDIFFSNINTNAENELNQYYENFRLNIISKDNFVKFLTEYGYHEYFFNNDMPENFLPMLKAKLERKIGIKDISKKDGLYIEGTQSVFFIHSQNLDGNKLLNEYVDYCYRKSHKFYTDRKEEQFLIVLEQYEAAKKIAEKINVKDPFYLDPAIDFKDQQISTFFNNAKLYFRGYEVLNLEISDMKIKLARFEESVDILRYNPVIDLAYNTSLPLVNIRKDIMPPYLKGLLVGLFISLIVIYLKSGLSKRYKSVKG